MDRGNALPLASIFFTLLLGGRRPPYPSPPFLLLPPCPPRPTLPPLRSPIESIKALGSGITCNRVSRSPKTRKRLVFSIDRSFSRLSVCVRARAHHRCSRELECARVPYWADSVLLLKGLKPPFILPSPSPPPLYLTHRTPSSYHASIYTHARTRTTRIRILRMPFIRIYVRSRAYTHAYIYVYIYT